MENTALLVIDMQEWFFHQDRPVYAEERLISGINSLLDAFHGACLPVLFIRHTNDTYLREGSADWALCAGMHARDGDIVLDKRARNAFAEPAVLSALERLKIGSVVLAGLVTHGCLRAACEGALQAGYAATLAADAHSSFDAEAPALVDQWNGRLAGQGARVIDTAEIVGEL